MDIHEAIFTIGPLLFTVALIPSVLGQHKPDWKTSFLTGSILTIYAITFADMGFWYSALTGMTTALVWFVLLAQKILQTHNFHEYDKAYGGSD